MYEKKQRVNRHDVMCSINKICFSLNLEDFSIKLQFKCRKKGIDEMYF